MPPALHLEKWRACSESIGGIFQGDFSESAFVIFKPSIWPKAWRLLVLGVAILLLRQSVVPQAQYTALALQDAKAFFPTATALREGGPNRSLLVLEGDRILGRLMTTSPEGDSVIGYAGPSNLLMALDSEGAVRGLKVLSSGDTDSHVQRVEQSRRFWQYFQRWRPESEPPPRIEALGGSTLTSIAFAEALSKRASGKGVSLKFPEPVTLEEARELFGPTVEKLLENRPRNGWITVRSSGEKLLGFLVRTSPEADAVSGYAGPSECLVAIGPDQQTLLSWRIRKSYDSEDYVDRVRRDEDYQKKLTRWTVSEWPSVDFEKAGVEGVAGATMTSYAVAESMRVRFRQESRRESGWRPDFKEMALWLVIAGSVVMSFSKLRGRIWARLLWQGFLVGCLGVWLGQFISIAQFAGWAKAGTSGSQSVGILLLVAVSLLVPWGSGKQIYCHQICPHGAAQEWLGRFRRLHVAVPDSINRLLSKIPYLLLAGAFLWAVWNPRWDLSTMEPFNAWVLRGGAVASLILACMGLVASLFVPQAYCRYGCPTGAVFKWLRAASSQERFGAKDWGAAVVLGMALLLLVIRNEGGAQTRPRPEARMEHDDSPREPFELRGSAFGTSWCVKLRTPPQNPSELHRALSQELRRLEDSLSPWNPESATSRFNRSQLTEPILIPRELALLVRFGQRLSAATEGAYDLTVAPLVDLWGFGPAGRIEQPPSREEIREALGSVGWAKLCLDESGPTLRKTDPRTKIIVSLVQGLAVDRIGAILKRTVEGDFLVELGGEMLASGSWRVGIEDPRAPGNWVRQFHLKDAALATSGLYRARHRLAGREISHIISPKTGEPIQSGFELCSVVAGSCLEAKGWVTAMVALERNEAIGLAVRERLHAVAVDRRGEVQILGDPFGEAASAVSAPPLSNAPTGAPPSEF